MQVAYKSGTIHALQFWGENGRQPRNLEIIHVRTSCPKHSTLTSEQTGKISAGGGVHILVGPFAEQAIISPHFPRVKEKREAEFNLANFAIVSTLMISFGKERERVESVYRKFALFLYQCI